MQQWGDKNCRQTPQYSGVETVHRNDMQVGTTIAAYRSQEQRLRRALGGHQAPLHKRQQDNDKGSRQSPRGGDSHVAQHFRKCTIKLSTKENDCKNQALLLLLNQKIKLSIKENDEPDGKPSHLSHSKQEHYRNHQRVFGSTFVFLLVTPCGAALVLSQRRFHVGDAVLLLFVTYDADYIDFLRERRLHVPVILFLCRLLNGKQHPRNGNDTDETQSVGYHLLWWFVVDGSEQTESVRFPVPQEERCIGAESLLPSAAAEEDVEHLPLPSLTPPFLLHHEVEDQLGEFPSPVETPHFERVCTFAAEPLVRPDIRRLRHVLVRHDDKPAPEVGEHSK